MLDRLSLAEGSIIVTSFGRIAFYVAILELIAVSVKAVVEGKKTVLDECFVIMTDRPDSHLVREHSSGWRRVYVTCRYI